MLQKINYQKELDRFITDLQKKKKSRRFCFTAAAPHAAVMCWNT